MLEKQLPSFLDLTRNLRDIRLTTILLGVRLLNVTVTLRKIDVAAMTQACSAHVFCNDLLKKKAVESPSVVASRSIFFCLLGSFFPTRVVRVK